MNTVLNKIKRFISKVKGFFPTSLPVGMTAFNKWSDNIISTYDMPDNDSSRFVLSVLIQQAPYASCRYSDRYFANRFWKGASNQVAAEVIQTLKNKQTSEIAAATAAAKALSETPNTVSNQANASPAKSIVPSLVPSTAEVTANTQAASSGQAQP
jgi:hypothetical protein